ncbi:MAG: oligosaccharide flippase family protein [Chitinophagales bacterium]
MSAQNFIQSFLKRKGAYVLFSSFAIKLLAFLLTLYVIRVIPKDEFGYIVYAVTIIAFILPFHGFGVHQGLLRYGSISESQQLKKYYFNLIIKRGIFYSAIMIAVICLLSPLLSSNLEQSLIYIIVLSFQLISLLLIESIRIYTRLINLNKGFAITGIYNSLILLLSAMLATYFWGGKGYVAALVLAPFFYSAYLIKRFNLLRYNRKLKPQHSIREFLSYGFYSSLGGVLSQLLYAVDILLIGNLIQDAEQLAQYKTSNIIPFSLHILPVAIMTTDFVKLAKNAQSNRTFIKDYYLNYLKVMLFICIGIIIVFYFFSHDILHIFGKQYTEDNNLMLIFSIGTVGALLLRIPLGNMLSAIGWPRVNAFFSLIVLLINVFAGYYFVLHYGVLGAAYTTVFLMWFSGILSLFALVKFLK